MGRSETFSPLEIATEQNKKQGGRGVYKVLKFWLVHGYQQLLIGEKRVFVPTAWERSTLLFLKRFFSSVLTPTEMISHRCSVLFTNCWIQLWVSNGIGDFSLYIFFSSLVRLEDAVLSPQSGIYLPAGLHRPSDQTTSFKVCQSYKIQFLKLCISRDLLQRIWTCQKTYR